MAKKKKKEEKGKGTFWFALGFIQIIIVVLLGLKLFADWADGKQEQQEQKQPEIEVPDRIYKTSFGADYLCEDVARVDLEFRDPYCIGTYQEAADIVLCDCSESYSDSTCLTFEKTKYTVRCINWSKNTIDGKTMTFEIPEPDKINMEELENE